MSGGQLDSLTHWEAWYGTNLHLLHSTIDIDTIWNNSPSRFNMKGLKILKMNIWTINFMLRQPTTKRVLWEIYRGASSTNLHPIFNKTTKKLHHYFEYIFKYYIFLGVSSKQDPIFEEKKQPRNHNLKIFSNMISFGVTGLTRIQFSRKQPRSLSQPLFTQHLFHVAENIKIFVFALPENARF